MSYATVDFSEDDFSTKEGREKAFGKLKDAIGSTEDKTTSKLIEALRALVDSVEETTPDLKPLDDMGRELSTMVRRLGAMAGDMVAYGRKENSGANIFLLGEIANGVAAAGGMLKVAMRDLATYIPRADLESEKPAQDAAHQPEAPLG